MVEGGSVLVDASPQTSVAVRPFSLEDKLALTIVAKVALDLSNQGPAALVDPEPIIIREKPYRPPSFVSIQQSDEIAFRKVACDVTLTGSAVAPGGKPAASIKMV
jgi:hypothetical protein